MIILFGTVSTRGPGSRCKFAYYAEHMGVVVEIRLHVKQGCQEGTVQTFSNMENLNGLFSLNGMS